MANTKASLTQQNTQTYPSNTSGSITALAVKSFNNNFINAVATLGDTNVFTEPQTFGDVVQVNSDITANNVYAGNIPYLSGSNVFTGPSNTFSGSVNIQTASIQLLTVDTIISSSTINATGSNTLGDATNDTQTLWGQVLVKGGPLRVSGSAEVSGSLISVGGFTGSLQGTASWADNATTASHALTAVSSSYALNATSASYALSSSFANNATSASYALSSSFANNAISASYALSSSQAANATSASYALNSTSASYALSSSNASTASSADNFEVRGELYANEINTITSAVNASTRSIIINGGDNTITSASLSSIFNSTTSQILGKGIDDNFESNNNTIIGGKTSVISGSNQSTILGGSVRMNNVTASVALARDTAYTASANYTLYTQNIQSSGSVVVTGSLLVTDGITGSLQGTASYAVQALSASWAPGGGGGTIETGSFATTGSNVFSGSQTFNTASLILNQSGSTPLFTNFTQSLASAQGAYANILLFPNTTNSGSFILSGSRNIGTINPLLNAGATIQRGGGNLSGNIGNFNIFYSTASSPATLTNNFVGGAVTNALNNTSSTVTLSGNFIGGAILVTGSSPTNVSITTNNIDAALITNDFTGSGANQSVSVFSNLIKGGLSQPNFAQIKFAATQSNGNSRAFTNNIMFGPANIASLEASGAVASTSNLLNTAIIGSNLVVSGTMANNSTSASMFVGQFNETGSLADPSQIKFAIGTGTTNAARRTSLFVSQSGEVVIAAPGGGTNTRGNSVFGTNFVKIAQNTVNANTTVAAFNASMATNAGNVLGLSTAVIAAEQTSITNGRASAAIGSSYSTINTNSGGGDTNNILAGAFDCVISGSRSSFTGIFASTGSAISESRHSAIIAANNARLDNTTGSVALGRDTAYTGSANYTLYTQNVNLSGSLTVNGNVQYNYGSYYNTASITLTANTSQSLNFTSIDAQSGFTLSGSNNEQIKATNAGVYNLQFSAQLDQGGNEADYYIWLKKNGSNVDNTAGKVTLASNHSDITSWNYVVSLAANDTLEIVIQSDANNSSVAYIAASGNIPAAPSVIATITQVK